MPDFQSLPTAIPTTEAVAPITSEQVAFAGEDLADDVALGIVLQDVEIAEKYLQSKGLVTALDMAMTFIEPM